MNHNSRWDADAPEQTLDDYGSGLLDAIEGVRPSREVSLLASLRDIAILGPVLIKYTPW